MRSLFVAITILVATFTFANVDVDHLATRATDRPVVNVPKTDRQSNWLGSQREGSCVYASMISLLRWQNRYETAKTLRNRYGNGEMPTGLAANLDREGIRYAYVTNGDVKFLEWAVRTRRGAAVTVMGGRHMICLVHLDSKVAILLDNNRVDNFIVVPREVFLAEWRASMGWAVTPIYAPAAPAPN